MYSWISFSMMSICFQSSAAFSHDGGGSVLIILSSTAFRWRLFAVYPPLLFGSFCFFCSFGGSGWVDLFVCLRLYSSRVSGCGPSFIPSIGQTGNFLHATGGSFVADPPGQNDLIYLLVSFSRCALSSTSL